MARSKREILALTTPPVAGADDIGGIRLIVGFHIRLAHGAAYRHFTETFSDIDLTQQQVSVLWLIDDHPAITQAGLSQHMRIDRATALGIVNRLQLRGYLVRGASPTDRRKQTLNLTAAGRVALARAREAIREHERWLKSRFTGHEVEMLIEMLTRIHQ